MSEVQWLFIVLAVLYGWECACWLRRGAVAFSTWGTDSKVQSPKSKVHRARSTFRLWTRDFGPGTSPWAWRVRHPGTLIGNQNGGFIFAAPLPPLGTLFVAHQATLSLSAEGVLAFVATNVNPGWRPAQTGRFVRYEDLRSPREIESPDPLGTGGVNISRGETRAQGRKVLVNGELLAACSSPGLARRCVQQLLQLASLETSQREAAIAESLCRAFDVGAVERQRQDFQKQAKMVRGLSNGLLGYVFGVVPAVIGYVGFQLSWLGLLVGLLVLTSATAFLFYRAHRALYPADEDERFTHTLTILLAPTTAMRAHDALSRPLLEGFHALTLAKVFLPHKNFCEFARRVLLDLRQPALPLCPSDSPAARETERLARGALQSVAEKFLKEGGVEPEALCRPLAPADESCRAYCPRCEAQFTSPAGGCPDCGGLELVPFGPRE